MDKILNSFKELDKSDKTMSIVVGICSIITGCISGKSLGIVGIIAGIIAGIIVGIIAAAIMVVIQKLFNSSLIKEKLIKDLDTKWEIKENRANAIVTKEKFPQYKELHYHYLKTAIEDHLRSLSKEQQEAYIQCKKYNYSRLYSVDELNTLFSGLLSVLSFMLSILATAIALFTLENDIDENSFNNISSEVINSISSILGDTIKFGLFVVFVFIILHSILKSFDNKYQFNQMVLSSVEKDFDNGKIPSKESPKEQSDTFESNIEATDLSISVQVNFNKLSKKQKHRKKQGKANNSKQDDDK